MKLSLKWLQEFVEIPENISPEELGNLLTLHTAEVDGIDNPAALFNHMVVGKIIELMPHPNADKLQITIVDIGEGKHVKIVCGGSNLYIDQLVAVALPKSQVKWHGEGDLITLEATTIRGEDSYGMICAAEEIGMGKSKDKEIMDLTHLKLPAGTPLNEALDQDDIIYDIDNKAITHRPDLWSHYGFAREIATITGGKLKPFALSDIEKNIPSKGEEITLDIQNPEILSHWTSLVINNIKVEKSPTWLQSKLEKVGLRSVNNIVDITNLVMYEIGQPMHAYDKDLLQDLNLQIRFAKKDEELETIDHKKRKLTPQDPVLSGKDQNPLIILGVMGGINSEISDNTTSIVLESATFDAVTIRKASTFHGLRSDASQRFEKSLDPQMCKKALLRATELILQLCPSAKIAGPITEIAVSPQKELVLELNPSKINKYLGFELPVSEVINILTSLEFQVKEGSQLQVTVPSFRATKDIQQEVDLIEEVVRIYGYEKIEEITPDLPAVLPILNFSRKREHQARTLLKGYGLSEVLNYSFYSKDDFEKTLSDEAKHLKLKNYLSEEQTHLRTTLVTNILKNLHQNLKNFNQVQIFEIGRTYIEEQKFFPLEEEKIAIAITGSKEPFAQLKGILELFFAEYSQEPLDMIVAKETPSYLHPNKSLQIITKENIEVGTAGIIHPLVQQNFDLNQEVAYAEINLGRLMHQTTHTKTFSPIAKFPSSEFDLSILVPEKFYNQDLINVIRKSSDLIESISLFDIYQGANLQAGHKALAYKIVVRAEDRTLTDSDLSQIQETCMNNIKKAGGQIRGFE